MTGSLLLRVIWETGLFIEKIARPYAHRCRDRGSGPPNGRQGTDSRRLASAFVRWPSLLSSARLTGVAFHPLINRQRVLPEVFFLRHTLLAADILMHDAEDVRILRPRVAVGPITAIEYAIFS